MTNTTENRTQAIDLAHRLDIVLAQAEASAKATLASIAEARQALAFDLEGESYDAPGASFASLRAGSISKHLEQQASWLAQGKHLDPNERLNYERP